GAQPIGSVRSGDFTGFVQVPGRMLLGQAEEALHDTHAFDAAGLENGLGPAGGTAADRRPGAIEHPGGPVLDGTDLLGDDVPRIGAEAPRLGSDMDGNLLHLSVEEPHRSAVPAGPDAAAQVLGWCRIVGTGDFHVAIAIDDAL